MLAQYMVYKFLQCARTLGKTDKKIMLQALILQAAFFYLLHTVDIIIAAAYNTNNIFPLYHFRIIIEHRNAHGTRRFSHYSIFIIQFQYGRTYFTLCYQVHFIQYFFANRKSNISNAFYGGTVNKTVNILNGYGVSCFQCCFH